MEPQTASPSKSDPVRLSRADRQYARRAEFFAWLIPAAFLLGIGVGYMLWGNKTSTTAAANTGAQNPQPTRYDIPVDDDPSIGPADAPITIVEFSDYQCPYCKKWHDEIFPRIMKTYPDQIRFVYRDFPLDGHAGAQGKYWEYHAALFSDQYSLDEAGFKKYASDLKLDETKFAECLASNQYEKEWQADYQFAAKLGVQSTPTFFINGLAVIGAQPFEAFKQVIDQELASQ